MPRAQYPNQKRRDSIDLYYVPASVVQEHALPSYVTGSNSVGGYHECHKAIKHLVRIDRVPLLSLDEVLTQHRVRGIGLLKLDTEGTDVGILAALFIYLRDKHYNPAYFPRRILFESNELIPPEDVQGIVDLYLDLGYVLHFSDGDTALEYKIL